MTSETMHAADDRTTSTKSISRHIPTAARILLGLVFFVFGLNGFLDFMPKPSSPLPEGAVALGSAFMKAGYLFPLIKGTEVLAGVMLLSNRFVPLALAILAPIVINIFAFHAFLAPSGIAVAAVVLALELYLAWTYRRVYRPMLGMRPTSA